MQRFFSRATTFATSAHQQATQSKDIINDH
jgi:hypothetical protein